MRCLLFFLALIDILAGLSFFFKPFCTYWIAIFILAKGLYSLVAATPHFSLLGLLDSIVGILMFVEMAGIHFDFFIYFGLASIAKGAYSILFSF